MRRALLVTTVLLLALATEALGQLSNPGGGAPGGTTCMLQFNDAGALGGFGCWDASGHTVTLSTLTANTGNAGYQVVDTSGRTGVFGLLGNNRVSVGTTAGAIGVDLIRDGIPFLRYNGDTLDLTNTSGVAIGGSVAVNITGGSGLYMIGNEPVLYRTKLADGVIDSSVTQVGLRSPSGASGKLVVCYDPTTGRLSGSATGTGCD